MFRRLPLLAAAALTLLTAAPQTTRKTTRPAATDAAAAARWMRSLSVREKAAQLILVVCFGETPNRRSAEYKRYVRWVRDLRVGGLIVNNRVVGGQVRQAEPHTMALFLNQMQRLARVPLIVGGDFERGASMRVSDTPKFPHPMAYGAAGDLAATRFLGAETARQARALGVHWIYAPTADVNNNPDNPIINIRSFGEDPQAVAQHVSSFIEGAHHDAGVKALVTVKHFPGHGDTATDSHLGLAVVEAPKERMASVELVPFRAAVEHNVDAVMTAHLAVPAYEPESIPATVSRNIVTGLLRDQLGFKGLVVTDAMDMAGLAKMFSSGEASVRALEAGVDVLLMPTDPDEAVNAIAAAVRSGRITRARLDESVRKVLATKARLGIARSRAVDLDNIADVIGNPEAEQRAGEAAEKALTLVRSERGAFPFRDPERSCVVVLTENRFSQGGRRLADEIARRSPKTRLAVLDPTADEGVLNDTLLDMNACDTVAVAAFATASAYKGSVALPGGLSGFVTKLAAAKPVALIALGNPYLLREFPEVAAYLCTFSSTSTSEAAAARALLGDIPVTGRMPVSIPGFAKIGDGIQLPARPAAKSN